jgi:hypothetical protein
MQRADSIRSTDYRQLVFSNVVNGMKLIIDAMDEWEMSVESHNRVSLNTSFFILTSSLCLRR